MGNCAAPAVGGHLHHRLLEEARRARGAVAHDGAQLLVAVAHEVALHDDGVAEAPLDRPAAAIDGRTDVVDLDARRRRAGHGDGHGRH